MTTRDHHGDGELLPSEALAQLNPQSRAMLNTASDGTDAARLLRPRHPDLCQLWPQQLLEPSRRASGRCSEARPARPRHIRGTRPGAQHPRGVIVHPASDDSGKGGFYHAQPTKTITSSAAGHSADATSKPTAEGEGRSRQQTATLTQEDAGAASASCQGPWIPARCPSVGSSRCELSSAAIGFVRP